MQKKNDEIKFWDKIANERIYAAFNKKEYSDMFQNNLNGLEKGAVVLDIGCASGISSMILSKLGYQVKGMDISPKLIEQANRLWKNEANQPEFFVGDAEKIPMDSESCDVCFLGGVIHHFPDYQRVINEILRVLKKGGILLVIEPNRLDMIERISWFFAGCLKLLSPNEYPVSPIEMTRNLEDNFTNFKVYPFRTDDIPFFSFMPLIGKFFKGGKGKPIKKIPLTLLNLFRPELHRGNFFVLSCIKK